MAQAITNEFEVLAAAPAALFRRLRTSYADHRTYRRTLGELAALSDRDLADIGLSRLNIRDIARESVYGR